MKVIPDLHTLIAFTLKLNSSQSLYKLKCEIINFRLRVQSGNQTKCVIVESVKL